MRFNREKIQQLLNDRGIQFEMLSESQSEALLRRFIEEFIEDKKRESVALKLRRSRTKQEPIEYYKYFQASCVRDVTNEVNKGEIHLLDWLSRDRKNSLCYLLWREPWIPVFQITSSSLTNRDLAFFPGIYGVSFETSRAFALTLDADKLLCERRPKN